MISPEDVLCKPYSRVIIPDETGLYAAELLEFPGCFADGETPEEAYANLEEIALAWIESAVAQGMAIPPPFADNEYSGAVSLRLPKSVHRKAAEFAYRDGVSLNTFLVSAVSAAVGAEEMASRAAARIADALARLATLQTSKNVIRAVQTREYAALPRGWSEEIGIFPGHDIRPISV